MRFKGIKIGDVAKVKGGKRLPKGMSVLDDPSDHPYLRVVDFGDGGIDRSNIKYIDEKTFDAVRRYTIDRSDIYISIAGTIGRVGIIPDDLSGANLTENAAKITEISDDIDHRYLMYYLRSSNGQGAIKNRKGGTSQPKLALYRIEDIDFPCPPQALQFRIASILFAYDDLLVRKTFVKLNPIQYRLNLHPVSPSLAMDFSIISIMPEKEDGMLSFQTPSGNILSTQNKLLGPDGTHRFC